MVRIAIIVGSKSDLTIVEDARPYWEFFGLECDLRVLSAHRQPTELSAYIKEAEAQGIEIFIACAGMAAHLPGVIAAQTHRPVIGVPLEASSLQGMDALLSIVQMPGGIPVGTMAIGKAGVINAVVYAARILGLRDQQIARRLQEFAQIGYKLA
jgi:phosphoribosylaminoimidazole carboxylase PurE protein